MGFGVTRTGDWRWRSLLLSGLGLGATLLLLLLLLLFLLGPLLSFALHLQDITQSQSSVICADKTTAAPFNFEAQRTSAHPRTISNCPCNMRPYRAAGLVIVRLIVVDGLPLIGLLGLGGRGSHPCLLQKRVQVLVFVKEVGLACARNAG
jgi:hypothetical protein